MTDLEGYTLQYETDFDNAARDVVARVPQNLTQTERARMFGVSVRTIQNFEKCDGRCRSYKLLYFYRLYLDGDAVV